MTNSLDELAAQIKACSKCGQRKSLSCFYKNSKSKDGRSSWCKDCANARSREYRRDNPAKTALWNKNSYPSKRKYYQEHREQRLQKIRDYEANLKYDVLSHYCKQSLRCARCGITDIDVLCIDHINGGGSKHRRSIGGLGGTLYHWLKKNNYPEGYQVLCFNCNFKKKLEDNREQRRA